MNFLILLILCFSESVHGTIIPKDKTVAYKNAIAVFKNNKITVSTGRIERTWEWTGNGLLTTSIINKTSGKEYAKIQEDTGVTGICPELLAIHHLQSLDDLKFLKMMMRVL